MTTTLWRQRVLVGVLLTLAVAWVPLVPFPTSPEPSLTEVRDGTFVGIVDYLCSPCLTPPTFAFVVGPAVAWFLSRRYAAAVAPGPFMLAAASFVAALSAAVLAPLVWPYGAVLAAVMFAVALFAAGLLATFIGGRRQASHARERGPGA